MIIYKRKLEAGTSYKFLRFILPERFWRLAAMQCGTDRELIAIYLLAAYLFKGNKIKLLWGFGRDALFPSSEKIFLP